VVSGAAGAEMGPASSREQIGEQIGDDDGLQIHPKTANNVVSVPRPRPSRPARWNKARERSLLSNYRRMRLNCDYAAYASC